MTISATKNFHYTCFLPFHLADPAGILFFSHTFTLFHQAFESFIVNHLHFSWENWFQNLEWIVPIKHAETHYIHPLEAGKECRIELSVTHFSTSSFSIIGQFYQNNTHCSTTKTVHVFCHRFTKEKIPFPHILLAQFKTLCPSVVSLKG